MTKMLLKRSLLNVRMLLVIFLSFTFLFSALAIGGYITHLDINGMETGVDLLYMYTVPFALSSFVVFAGIFPGIPYAYSYLEEHNSGYLRFIQLRVSRKRYARQKILFSGLSGGISMLIPGILIFIVLDILSTNTTPDHHSPIFETLMWAPYMYIWGGRLVLLIKAVLMFLFGFMWAELALAVSLIFKNRYVSFIMPFLIYLVCGMLVKPNEINPMILIRSDYELGTPLIQPFLIICVYIGILCVINWFLFRRQDRR